MSFGVEYTSEFECWWNDLDYDEQESIAVIVGLLEERGSGLGFPYSSGIKNSKYNHMRELRIQHAGDPYRILYAFDPRRNAILLIGGCKTGTDRWYEEFVPKADRIYSDHLCSIDKEKK